MTSSDLYSKLAISTFKSLFLNNADVDDITIYYIGDKLSEQSKTNLINLVNEYNRKIVFVPMPEHFDNLAGSNRNGQTVFCYGHIIIDFSIHDAIVAGFRKIVFIIRHDIEDDFKAAIGNRIEEQCKALNVELAYAFQELSNVPTTVPDGRKKPWGTGHAVLACDGLVDSPFAVINADDYYGKNGFKKVAEFLEKHSKDYALVGYQLKNTLSDNGGVTRGICSVDDGKLIGIKEMKNIVKTEKGAEVDGQPVDIESIVSMNFWCYPAEFIDVLKTGFPRFLDQMKDPLKDEYLLPIIADGMLKTGTEFSVLPTDDKWFGVTYKEDKPAVVENFRKLIDCGEYKANLYNDLKDDR